MFNITLFGSLGSSKPPWHSAHMDQVTLAQFLVVCNLILAAALVKVQSGTLADHMTD